ncbi:MAG TPA: hypothetical protein VIM53_04775 [Candidatus Saccharimonadales bacterium]
MFDKDQLYHLWTRIRPIKTLYLFVAFLISASICIVALRHNNLEMVKLRTAVYSADQNNGDVNAALKKLQTFVVGHMNTSLNGGNGSVYPPIQLKYTYQRLQQAASDDANAAKTKIYTDAQTYCQQLDPTDFSGKNRVPCIENYVTTHPVAAATVPTAMYEFDFVSPSWSPDLAGWSLLVSIALLAATAVRFALGSWLKRATK